MKNLFLFLGIIIFTFEGCKNRCELPEEVAALKDDIQIERLENDLFACASVNDVLDFLNNHETLKIEFLGSKQYPSDTILAKSLFGRIRNPYLDSLRMDANEEFGDMSDVKLEFENAFAYVKRYDPSLFNGHSQRTKNRSRLGGNADPL